MFRFVPPDELSSVWEFVEPGLVKVLTLTKEPWYPRDVKSSLRNAQSALFVHEHGFVVLERCQEAHSQEPYLNAWVAYFEPGKAKAIRSEFLDFLDAQKKLMRCEWIQFTSPRAGWVGLEPDFHQHAVIWRR